MLPEIVRKTSSPVCCFDVCSPKDFLVGSYVVDRERLGQIDRVRSEEGLNERGYLNRENDPSDSKDAYSHRAR